MKKALFILLLAIAMCNAGFAQKKEAKVIQFSGYTLTADSLIGIPYTRITVVNHARTVYANAEGFFSFAAVEGDTVYFTSIGYRPVLYFVPTMDGDKFSVVQLMTKSDIMGPTTIIFPWGDKSNFHKYFVDLQLPEDQMEIAKRNLGRDRLAQLGENLPYDGQEHGELNLRNRSAQTYYYGQVAPQNIFNPLAWAEFIKAWKNGDFSKKSNSNSNNTNTNPEPDIYSAPQPTPPASPSLPSPTMNYNNTNSNVLTPPSPLPAPTVPH